MQAHLGSCPAASTVTVSYATADGTATAGRDYAAKTGIVSFAPGATTASVKVSVSPDTAREGDEVFPVTLSGSSGPAISHSSGVGTIADDD